MKAWRVRTEGFQPGVVHAKNRGQARYREWRAAHDMGFKILFGDIHVKRAPEYDDLPKGQILTAPYTECVLKEFLGRTTESESST